jgi:hypothetical protein
MGFIPSTHDNALQKRKGFAHAELMNDDGTFQAATQLSPSSELNFSIATEETPYISQESGVGEILDNTIDSVTRTFTLTCNRMTREIRALFVVGKISELSQPTGSVTVDISGYVAGGRSFQLGGSTNNGAGIFGVTSVVVSSYEGLEADAHATSTVYEVGDFVVPATPNDHWYVCTAGGTSHTSAPTWPTNGGTVAETGGVTWRDLGLIEYVAGTDYELDADYAIGNIPSTGAIATAAARIPAVIRDTGKTFRLSSDYTRSAKTVNQIAADSERGSRECRFRFYTQNPKGGQEVWYAPLATLTPTGDWSQKTGSDWASCQFTVTCKKPPIGESLYINDKPA